MVAGAKHLVQRADLERHMMQPGAGIAVLGRLEQGDAVMVGVEADERGTARHHVVLIQIGNPEAENIDVKPHRPLDIRHEQRDMADLTHLERRAVRPFQFGQRYSHWLNKLLAACTVVSWPSTGLAIAASSERAGIHSASGRTIASEPI